MHRSLTRLVLLSLFLVFSGGGGCSQIPLHDAITSSYTEESLRLIEAREGMTAIDARGEEPLHFAARRGQLDVIAALLDAGISIESPSRQEDTALIVAATTGQTEAVRFLLDRGARINATNRFGGTPLHGAAFHGNLDVIRLLLEKGARVNARTSASDPLSGRTPLYNAAMRGNAWSVEILHRAGADVNATVKGGVTPVQAAAAVDHRETAKVLIGCGAGIGPVKDSPTLSGKLRWASAELLEDRGDLNAAADEYRAAAEEFEDGEAEYARFSRASYTEAKKYDRAWLKDAFMAGLMAGLASAATGQQIYVFTTTPTAPDPRQRSLENLGRRYGFLADECEEGAEACREKEAAIRSR